jgi:hypothetical protein
MMRRRTERGGSFEAHEESATASDVREFEVRVGEERAGRG